MRIRILSALFLAVSAACSSNLASSGNTRELSLQVAGFVQAEGITWLGWPNRVQGALEGHPGIRDVRFDIDAERFDVTYQPGEVSSQEILDVVSSLGFEPEIATAREEDAPASSNRVELARLPAEFRSLFTEAAQAARPVLLDFTAPGWSACERMDTVTYPDPRMRSELEHWIERKVDVTLARSVADVFEVTAVPVAIAVTGEGRILARVFNFVEPAVFRSELSRLRRELAQSDG